MSLAQLKHYAYLMRLDKPIGIFLLLWPTFWALWFAAHGQPNIFIVLIFVCGVIIMRSAGCIINDVFDRKVDGFVLRTKNRPLVTGKVSVKEALILFFILSGLAFLLVLQLNTFSIQLAFIGMGLTIFYPLLKRITHLPQVGLGLAFAWGVPLSFAAQKNAVPLAAWILFFAVLLWAIIYDTMYAMVDRPDDIRVGIKSTAILFGQHDKLILGILQIIFVTLLGMVGFLFSVNLFYYVSLLLVIGCCCYQQYLIKDRIPERCFQAFLNNHVLGLIVFIGIILGFL